MEPLPAPPILDEIFLASHTANGAQVVADSNAILRNELGNQHIALPDWWDYHWTVEHDNEHGYSGTMPKRIKKWLYVEHQIKPDDQTISDIGERIKYLLPKELEWYIDVTHNLDWTPGTYGEATSSCWWTDRAPARILLEENGGMALRRYRGIDGGPQGRCWIAVRDDHYMLFNAYGGDLIDYARLFAGLLGLSYKNSVGIRNLGRSSGLVYANGNSGTVVGPLSVIKDMSMTDMQIDVSEYAPMCNYCGIDLWSMSKHPIDDRYYACDSCHNKGVRRIEMTFPGRQIYEGVPA